MEAKKTRDLLSANRRPRKICGVIQSESEGLRIRSADGVSSDLGLKPAKHLSNGWGKTDIPAQARESASALPLPFCSIWTLNGLDEAHLHWGGPYA